MNLFKRIRSFLKKKDVKLQKVEKRVKREMPYDREIGPKINTSINKTTYVKPTKGNLPKAKQENKRNENYSNDDNFIYGSTVGIISTSTDYSSSDSGSCSNHSSYDSSHSSSYDLGSSFDSSSSCW